MIRRGFTLIEILLALSIFVIILALAGTMLSQTLQAQAYLETRGTDQRLAIALISRIGADVRDAISAGNDADPNNPSHFLASKGDSGLLGIGGGQVTRLDLVTLANGQPDDQGREPDVCEAGYLCTTTDGVHWQLYRREQPLMDNHPTQGGEYLLLTDRLGSFSLQYSDDGANWQDSYDNKQAGRLPWMVKVDFTLLPPEGTDQPPPGTPAPAPPEFERIFFLNRYGLTPTGG